MSEDRRKIRDRRTSTTSTGRHAAPDVDIDVPTVDDGYVGRHRADDCAPTSYTSTPDTSSYSSDSGSSGCE